MHVSQNNHMVISYTFQWFSHCDPERRDTAQVFVIGNFNNFPPFCSEKHKFNKKYTIEILEGKHYYYEIFSTQGWKFVSYVFEYLL